MLSFNELPTANFSAAQAALIQKLEADLAVQLASNAFRLEHSLSVAHVAEGLALIYAGLDPYALPTQATAADKSLAFEARCAGILHDWEKAHPSAEDVPHARELGIDMGVNLELVAPLLHGKIAARTLPTRYPELPASVWQAIERHTTGAHDMSVLDMVVFIADYIEPKRGSRPSLDALREQVGKVSLAELYFQAFSAGAAFVLETRRYLYPQTIDLYNELVEARRLHKKGLA